MTAPFGSFTVPRRSAVAEPCAAAKVVNINNSNVIQHAIFKNGFIECTFYLLRILGLRLAFFVRNVRVWPALGARVGLAEQCRKDHPRKRGIQLDWAQHALTGCRCFLECFEFYIRAAGVCKD
jgi:hypothetical protein